MVAKGDDPNAGYAVPIGVADSVANDILAFGRARHAWLGVTGDDLGDRRAAVWACPAAW